MSKKKKHLNNHIGTLHYPEPFEADFIPHILKELYIENVYAEYLAGRRDLTVFDLGAHIGLFTRYVRRFASKVYAVEPARENYQCLVANTKNDKAVSTYNVAITGKDGEMTLYHSGNKTAHTLINGNREDSETVTTWSIETLFSQTKVDTVDFVKMDIEGSEFDVLSSKAFQTVAPRIKMIIGELHDWAGVNYGQAKWALKDAGFEVFLPPHDATIFVARRLK